MLSLANWQLNRLEAREVSNTATKTAMSLRPIPIRTSNLPPDVGEFRRATITGKAEAQHTVYRRYPLKDGRTGYYVLRPYRLSGGGLMMVNEGWLPVDIGKDDVLPMPDNGAKSVQLEGLLRDFENKGGSVGATIGGLPTVAGIEQSQLTGLVGAGPLAPKWLQLTNPQPGPPLEGLSGPDLSKGPHRSYALQWLAFTVITIVGYGVLLRRTAKEP